MSGAGFDERLERTRHEVARLRAALAELMVGLAAAEVARDEAEARLPEVLRADQEEEVALRRLEEAVELDAELLALARRRREGP